MARRRNQRTNEFQHLVTLIQEALAPRGAKVTASHLQRAPTSGEPREIDILVESSTGPYSIRVAVEAKDEGRKFDVTKMETIIGKYFGRGSIRGINLVVVVCRNGFTPEALVRAKDEGIVTMTIQEALSANWGQVLMATTFNIRIDPVIDSVEIVPPPPKEVDFKKAVQHGKIYCDACSQDHGSPLSRIMHELGQQLASPGTKAVLDDVATTGGTGEAKMNFDVPLPNRYLEVDGRKMPLERILARALYVRASGPIETKRYTMSETGKDGAERKFIYSTGKIGKFKVDILVPIGDPTAVAQLKIEREETAGPPGKPLWKFENGQLTKCDPIEEAKPAITDG